MGVFIIMADFEKMYYSLFRSSSKAIEILIQAQREAEEMFLSSKEPSLTVLHPEERDA